MDIIAKIAEEKIKEAIERGFFKDLPGAGMPLEMDDLSLVPEELRMCYKVLKNAGLLPPELELRKEIATLELLLETIDDERVLESTISTLNEKIMRLNIIEKRSLPLEKKQYYAKSLRKKLRAPSTPIKG
ncbi:MAG: DUF1992 domain-containing protein [Deltaproteobacteria bacterium]|nr:DUF1992 domain-containing protein [Deltaproteobacteria bacterium]